VTQIQATVLKKKMRACWFASFKVPLCWYRGVKSSIRSYLIFWRLEFFGKISESHAMFPRHAVLQPGEIRTWWPAKCVGNLEWHVYNFSGTWAPPMESCIARNINSEVKARKKVLATDLSTVLSWKSPCQSISACACDFSGSWNQLHKRSIARSLRASNLEVFFDRQIDADFLLPRSISKRATCCSTHIHGTHSCSHTTTWTTGECLLRFLLSVCLHFAFLVTFSWQAIQRLRSGFCQPKPFRAHAEMLWDLWFSFKDSG
jgi:hypothetical protein